MLLFFVFFLGSLVILKKRDWPNFFACFVSGIIALIGTFVLGVFIYGFSDCTDEYRVVSKQELVAISDQGNNLNGRFFLGCGSIKDEFYYFCYIQEKDGTISFSKFLASDKKVKILEEKRDKGILEKRKVLRSLKKTVVNKILLYPFLSRFTGEEFWFRVPEKTIKRNMSLDLN